MIDHHQLGDIHFSKQQAVEVPQQMNTHSNAHKHTHEINLQTIIDRKLCAFHSAKHNLLKSP